MIGFIFLSRPSNKGDNNVKVRIPIFSPTLFSFLFPVKKDGLNIPKKIAQIAKLNLVKSFFFVSSGYADSKSSADYLKFKGLVEEELKRLNFSKLGIMRPSFLMGNRKENRVGERLGIFTFKLISPLLLGPLKKIRPIHSDTVAKAMIKIANNNFQQNIFESNEIEELNNS